MRTALLGFAVLLVLPLARAEDALTIAVRPDAAVDAQRVALADVAAITGGSPALARSLGSIDLGPAPAPGAEREVTRGFLVLRLQQERLDPAAIVWTGPERTRVERRSTRLAGVTLAQVAADHVRKSLPWPDEDLSVEVVRPPADLHVAMTGQDVDYSVTLSPGARLLGTVPCSVTVAQGDRVVGRASVLLQVRVFQQLVLASRRIRAGERLTKDLVRLQRTELTNVTADGFTRLADALGQEARHDIQPFAVITQAMVSAPRVVRRGALVTLVAESATLQVRARGIAQQDGAVGEWVPVRNLDSSKIVYGRVRDAETLDVRF